MEVQYQKNSNEKGYNNNYHQNYNKNLKINITNLPDDYTDKEISKLCEEFGKFEICNIKRNNRDGKFAIVKFSNETEAKTALEKLNNKEVDKKKLIVKELHNSHNYSNYNNYNYNKRVGNYPPLFYNFPMAKFEDTLIERNNLYVSNIPPNATKEDLEKTFGQYGPIKNIKLDEDTNITKELKEKVKFMNRGFGYVLFEKAEDAAKAIESLNGKFIIGFETYFKNLIVDYFIPKDKRNLIQGNNMYNIPNAPLYYPPQLIPPPPYFMQIPMGLNPIPNNPMRPQQQFYNQGNYKNGFGFRRNNRGRGRGGKNYQRRNIEKKEEEKKILFDHEYFNKLETEQEKKEFLGEKLFNLIQENSLIKENNEDSETVGKITGMILGIPLEEIIDILENPGKLESRIKEALDLIKQNK